MTPVLKNSGVHMLTSRHNCKPKTTKYSRNINITLQMWTWLKISCESTEILKKKSKLSNIKNGWATSTRRITACKVSRTRSFKRSRRSKCLSHRWRVSSRTCSDSNSKTRITSRATSLLRSASSTLLALCSSCQWRHKRSCSRNKRSLCSRRCRSTMKRRLNNRCLQPNPLAMVNWLVPNLPCD